MLCCISLVLSGCGGSEGSGADFASTEVHSGVEDAESASEKNEDIVESQEDETGVSAEVVDTSLWHQYETPEFIVKYPSGWQPKQYGSLFDFRPRGNDKGGFVWVIRSLKNDGDPIESTLAGAGAQFGKDREYARNDIVLGETDAHHVLVTTSRDEDFHYEIVFVESDETVYIISNTEEDDPLFKAFYESFELK